MKTFQNSQFHYTKKKSVSIKVRFKFYSFIHHFFKLHILVFENIIAYSFHLILHVLNETLPLSLKMKLVHSSESLTFSTHNCLISSSNFADYYGYCLSNSIIFSLPFFTHFFLWIQWMLICIK